MRNVIDVIDIHGNIANYNRDGCSYKYRMEQGAYRIYKMVDNTSEEIVSHPMVNTLSVQKFEVNE